MTYSLFKVQCVCMVEITVYVNIHFEKVHYCVQTLVPTHTVREPSFRVEISFKVPSMKRIRSTFVLLPGN